jgi:hypothetical protein
MICELAQEVRLNFLISGITISPTDFSYKSDKPKKDFSRATITQEAGQHLNEYATVPEPVEVEVGGRHLCNVYLPKEGLTISDKNAELTLYDCQKILANSIVDKRFHSVTLENVVDWYAQKIEDAELANVIEGVELMNMEDVDPRERTEDFRARYQNDLAEGIDETFHTDAALQKINAWTYRTLEDFTALEEEGGFDFDQMNLQEVLVNILDEFELDARIDSNRVIRIGDLDIDSTMYAAGIGRETWDVSDYDLTFNPNHVEMVQVKGGYEQTSSYHSDVSRSGGPTEETNSSRYWAFASTIEPESTPDSAAEVYQNQYSNDHPQQPEGRIVPVDMQDVTDKETLRNKAVKRLKRELMREISGSISVNPLTSSIVNGYPQELEVGDILAVFPPEDAHCRYHIPDSMFYVSGITHQISGSTGWNLDVRLTKIPMKTMYAAAHAWPTVPSSDDTYENAEQYYHATAEYDEGSLEISPTDDYE